MNGRTAFVLGIVGVGAYMIYKQAQALPGIVSGLGVTATAGPTVASIQAALVTGAQQAQTIIETPITIPPPPALIR